MVKQILLADGVRDALQGKLLLSVLAGITTSQLHQYLGDSAHPCHVVRAMPNLSSQLRESMTIIAISDHPLPPSFALTVEWTFNQIGRVKFVGESIFDPASHLAGASGALMTVALEGLNVLLKGFRGKMHRISLYKAF